ncbi:hypothetical protein HaLaN_12057, partial [Haematococcus lacustris]
ATAVAYSSALSYVNVEGKGSAQASASSTAWSTAWVTATAITDSFATAIANNAQAASSCHEEDVKSATATAISSVSTFASSTGGAALSQASDTAVATAVAKAVGWWLDRDTNACLSIQRIRDCMQRALELCSSNDREALPPTGNEYQQCYNLFDDRLPKLDEEMAELSMKRHNHAKQLVVFFGAATIGTGGGWGADAVLRACRKVVCRPRGPDQLRGRVVLVDEHRTSRVSSAVNGQQPCEEELDKLSATRPAGWKPPAGQVEQRLPGRWLDRDCNAALNMQRIGESRWRPLELCYWPDQGALPAKGKEYPGLGYKRLRDKPPKAQEQQPPAEAQ